MTWEEFYERYDAWADSTLRKRVSSLKDFKNATAEQIIEVASVLPDEKDASRFVRKAITSGVRLSAEDVLELLDWVTEDLWLELAMESSTRFTKEQLEELELYLSEKDVDKVAKHFGIQYGDDEDGLFAANGNEEWDEEIEEYAPVDPVHGRKGVGLWWTLLAILGALGKHNQSHDNETCADRPPHYGYRYGRWYYGNDHRYGCEPESRDKKK